jgi:hypothetical protein
VTGLRDRNSLFLEGSNESDEKWYVGPKCCACIVIIQLTTNDVCFTMSKGAIQKMSCRRSKRSIKTRKFYTAGIEADGRWVEETTRTATSIQKEELLMHRHIQWQASLQQEVDEDGDATVVMKDDAEEDSYSMSDEMHEDSDAKVMMKDDAKRNTCSPCGDETKEKRSELAEDMGKCTVRTEEEINILNINYRPPTNTKMLFLS